MSRRALAVVVLVLFVSAGLAPASAAHTLANLFSPETHLCGGIAPTVTWCQNGNHSRVLDVDVEVLAGETYTGVIRITIEPALAGLYEERVFHCAIEAGVAASCATDGPPVPRLVPFVATCQSFELPASRDPADAGSPGGEGAWFCSLVHR